MNEALERDGSTRQLPTGTENSGRLPDGAKVLSIVMFFSSRL
jgi:hypothetical protein